MGFYINPKGQTKEAWLQHNGERIPTPSTWPAPEGKAYVCMVDNGPFKAAAIAYSKGEMEEFADTSSDPRPRSWHLVPKDILYGVSDIKENCFRD
jgi:hypothetical protein